jgi:FKBP-type peptidyl-prolyl cis-trans isomerase (trigger factor)
LETTSEQLEVGKARISVTVAAVDADRRLASAYRQAAKNRIPGFRPGKAPRQVLNNHFGGKDYFLAQATEELVREYTPLAVDAEGLIALGRPEFDEFTMVQEGADFSYAFQLEVIPQLELSSYDPIQIELPSADPTEEEIKEQLTSLLEYYVSEDEDGQPVLPELTDAWVKETLEFENVEELRNRLTDSLRERKQEGLPALREFLSSQEIARRLVGDVPEAMVRQTEQDNYKDLFQSLQNQRLTLDAYLQANQLTPEAFRDSMHAQAHQSAAIALALDALARHLKLSVSDDELKEEFEGSGAQNSEALLQRWQSSGRLSEIRQGILRMKAARHVQDTAEIQAPGTLSDAPSSPEKKTTTKKKTTKKKVTAVPSAAALSGADSDAQGAKVSATDSGAQAAKSKLSKASTADSDTQGAATSSRTSAKNVATNDPSRSTSSKATTKASTADSDTQPTTPKAAPRRRRAQASKPAETDSSSQGSN